MKYREDLVEQVRSRQAQIKCDSNNQWNDLLNHIFIDRNSTTVAYNYYTAKHSRSSDEDYKYDCKDSPYSRLIIFDAVDFIIPEPKWVQASNDGEHWDRCLLIVDIGDRFEYPIIVITEKHSEEYLNGLDKVSPCVYKFMREIKN